MDFKSRLIRACDDSPIVPPYGKGRQVAIAKRLGVTQEAVRKWFVGEALPRPDKMRELADYLEVDEPYLALGIKPDFDRHEKRRNLIAYNGAVHLVAGLIMLEGGNVAFPSDKDHRAAYVDLYAIMRGQQMAIHVSLAREVSEGSFELIVPHAYRDVRSIGVIQVDLGKFQFIDMPLPLIDKHKTRKSGDYLIGMGRHENKYLTGGDVWPRFKIFQQLV